MKTFQLADFTVLSQEYISIAEDENLYAEVKLSGENNRYIDFLSIGKVNGGKLGSKQQERARALRDELLQQVTDTVKAAGWSVSNSLGFTSYKRNGKKQDTVTPILEKAVPVASIVPVDTRLPERAEQRRTGKDGNNKPITVGSYTRTVKAKSITFVCAHCGQTVTQERYPSPKPMYCTSACKKEVEKEQTRRRVQQLRAGRKKPSQVGE